MARGYSANRSKNGRDTLRMKRERSVSVHALKNTIESKKKMNEEQNNDKAQNEEEAVAKKKVVVDMRTPSVRVRRMMKRITSAAAEEAEAEAESTVADKKKKVGSSSVRAPSLLRGRLAELEEEMESEMEMSEDEHETVAKPDVMTKYKAAGRVVDEVLDILAAACVPGANTKDLCDQGDLEVASRLKSLYAKAKNEKGERITKGVSYPTNISVDEVLCNHSPFRADEAVVLRGNQVVKVHVGCHLDGFPVSAARTVVVPVDTSSETNNKTLSLDASNAIEAARVSLTGMVHLLRPGTLNADITDFIADVGNYYGVQAVEGVLSNRTKRWVMDGMDCIIARRVTTEDPQQDVEDCEIGPQQVWTLDVAFTDSAAYRMTPADDTTCLFRRTPDDFREDARVMQANQVLTEITNKHFCFPFHFKSLQDPLRGKMGINVLVKHSVVDRLPTLRVKGTKHIATRFSATVAVTAKRIVVLCGMPPVNPIVVSDALAPKAVPTDVADVLGRSLDFATAAALREQEGQPARKRTRTEKK